MMKEEQIRTLKSQMKEHIFLSFFLVDGFEKSLNIQIFLFDSEGEREVDRTERERETRGERVRDFF